MRKQVIFFLIFLNIVYGTAGQSFNDHHVITTGSMPSHANSMEIVDLNGDGEKDILACTSLGKYIYYLENKGNQEFEVLHEFEYDLYELNEIGSGDLNNDGLVDLVYSRYDYSSQLAWYKNLGDNEFSQGGVLYSVPSPGWRSVSFLVTELNGDGVDDVIILSANTDHNDLLYRLNMGDGAFLSTVSVLDTGIVVSYSCNDIDQDGDNDIIYATKSPSRLIAAINDGTGDFSEQITLCANNQSYIYQMLVFDTDGDNDDDILGFASNDSISLFINEGDLLFTPIHMANDSIFTRIGMQVIDFDNDGDLDIMNSYMAFLENVGNNRFEFKIDVDFPFYLGDYKICDLNNNDDEDIVFGFLTGAIGYIPDASPENLFNWRTLTSQLLTPQSPDYQNINDDPYPDICLLDLYYKYVFYLNNGSGQFIDTLTMDRLHKSTDGTAFYDVNDDGFCDIISYGDFESSNFNDGSHFKLAQNNGDHTFSKINIDDFNNFHNKQAKFIDYDGDGRLNAILTNSYVNGFPDSIFLFNVNTDFTLSIYDTIVFNFSHEIRNFKFQDIDKNGQNDFVLNDEHTLYIFYAENNRFNNAYDTLVYSEKQIFDFEFTNIQGDTLIDLVYSTQNYIGVLENWDGSTFQETYQLETGHLLKKLMSTDLDFDGLDELISVSLNNISVIQNIENSLYSVEDYYYKNDPYGYFNEDPFIFTDMDGDGDEDLLCTNIMESDLSWFENAHIDTLGYVPFPENDAIWTEQNEIYNGTHLQTWTSLFQTETDTLLNNVAFTNIYEYYLHPDTFDTIRQLYASIRQDKLAKKVFIIRHYLSELTERLLLDFKVNVGDTVKLDAYYWNSGPENTDSLFIVDSITTTILYNAEARDLFYLSNHDEQFPVSLQLIEGVGSIQNPFGPAVSLSYIEQTPNKGVCCPVYLVCQTIDEVPIYVLNETSSCNSLEVWSSIETHKADQFFEIYPNPAKDNLSIKFQETPDSTIEIFICNMQGDVVYQSDVNLTTSEFIIDLDAYKSGVYILRVNYENTPYSSRLIILE